MTSSGTSRTTIVFAVFLAALLTLAAIFAPRLIDLRSLNPTIATELSRALGQDVSVRGDIFLSLIPRPQLIIRDVATKPYNGSKFALSTEEARADLSWRDLVLGRYTIDTLTLRRAEIEGGWADISLFGGTVPQLSLDRARLTLHAASGPLMIEGLDATVTPAANGAFSWAASGVIDSLPISFAGKLSAPSKSNARNGQLTLTLPEADVAVELAGAISPTNANDTPTPSFKGRVNFSALHAADALGLMAFAELDLSRWPWSAQPLSLSGEVEASAQGLSIISADIDLGGQTARLSGGVDLTLRPKLHFNVELAYIDLAQWLPIGAPQRSPSSLPLRSSALRLLTEQPWTAEIKINGSAIRLAEKALRDATLDLAYDAAAWTIRNAAVTLPGQARVSVAGQWTASGDDAGFTGSWRGDIQDVRGFLSWLGIDSAAILPGRLANFSSSGIIQNNAKLTVLSDLVMSFDATQAKGRVAFGWDKATPFSIDLDIDRLALDQYAPLIRQGIGAIIGLPSKSDQQATVYGVNPLAPWMGNLAAQRGLVRIGVPVVTWSDVLAGALGIDVAFGDGVIDVRSIAFADTSGAAAWVGGKIKNLDGVPTAESLQFDIKIADVARFARASRADIPAPLRVLAPWSLTGALNGSLLDATVVVDGKLGPITATARGKASLEDRNFNFDLAADVTHPNANTVRDLAWGGVKFTTKLDGPLNLAAKIKRDGTKLTVGDVAAAVGRHRLRGNVDIDASTQPRTVTAVFSELDIDFAALTPLPVLPIPPPGRWQGEVKLSGPRLRSSLFDASRFTARFVAGSNSVELAEWQGKLFGGQSQVGMKWAKAPDATTNESVHQLQGQIVLNGADPALIFEGPSSSSKAQADLTLSFSTSAATPNGWLKSLSGTGSARMSLPANAPFKASGVFAPLAAVAQAEGPVGQVPAKQESSVGFAINNGIATLNDLRIQSNAYSGAFGGAVDFNRQMFDLKGTLKLRDRGVIVGPSAQLVLPPTVPMAITGPIATPTIKLDVSRTQR